ncbi:hypothetical protein DRP53_02315 [candidate division WOR-3 bacterium]|uniref:BioF2-like acetyltransferase domain-containing protein n=1 Tax=candidate division WOR-3 bacterium TaxID=2052148 RepID=A0A660SMM2_UNCW3|nr:MAG: hypothetical protein DRP53_02315 [candidate division WOR-3 bacterium]
MDAKSRHELRRKLRGLVPGQDLGILFHLMAVSDQNKARFLTPEIKAFFTGIGQAFKKRGWLRYRILEYQGCPIDAIFSFQIGDCVYVYNMGFDPEYRGLSPGIVMLGQDIREAIEAGFGYYDFLRGDELLLTQPELRHYAQIVKS